VRSRRQRLRDMLRSQSRGGPRDSDNTVFVGGLGSVRVSPHRREADVLSALADPVFNGGAAEAESADSGAGALTASTSFNAGRHRASSAAGGGVALLRQGSSGRMGSSRALHRGWSIASGLLSGRTEGDAAAPRNGPGTMCTCRDLSFSCYLCAIASSSHLHQGSPFAVGRCR
jgi:hypothetical protein